MRRPGLSFAAPSATPSCPGRTRAASLIFVWIGTILVVVVIVVVVVVVVVVVIVVRTVLDFCLRDVGDDRFPAAGMCDQLRDRFPRILR